MGVASLASEASSYRTTIKSSCAVSLSDPRLTAGERRFLRDIAGKLIGTTPRQPLPPEYQRAIDEVFGVPAKDRDRWQSDR